jgi:hypothetical protein
MGQCKSYDKFVLFGPIQHLDGVTKALLVHLQLVYMQLSSVLLLYLNSPNGPSVYPWSECNSY